MYIYIRETYNALCSNLTSNFTLRKRKPQGFTSEADLKHRPLYDIIYFNIPYFSPPRNSISTTDFHRRPPTSNKSSLYTIPCFSSREQTRLLPENRRWGGMKVVLSLSVENTRLLEKRVTLWPRAAYSSSSLEEDLVRQYRIEFSR